MGDELFFEGKKYISARRASQITGYNSDYIGQLCRKGSLKCRLVGRSWFVSEISLKEHKVEAGKTPRGRIPIYQKEVEEKIAKEMAEIPEVSREGSYLSFRSESHNLIPSPFGEPRFGRHFNKKVVALCIVIMLSLLASPFLMRGEARRELVTFLRDGINRGAVSEIAKKTNPRASEERTPSSPAESVESTQSVASAISSFGDFKESLAIGVEVIKTLGIKTGEVASGIYRSLALLPEKLFDTARGMKKLVLGGLWSRGDDRGGAGTESSFEFPGDNDGTRGGITVVPSTGDSEKDEKLKQYIKDSFSGETNILPDDSGDSGVIKPIFKKQDDQSYLYVLVPVRDKEKK